MISVFHKEGLNYSPRKDNDGRCHKPVGSLLFYSRCSLYQVRQFYIEVKLALAIPAEFQAPTDFCFRKSLWSSALCLWERTSHGLSILGPASWAPTVNQRQSCWRLPDILREGPSTGSSRRKLAAVERIGENRRVEGSAPWGVCRGNVCMRAVKGGGILCCPAKATAHPASRLDCRCSALREFSQHQLAERVPPSAPPPPTGELPRGWEPASKTQDDALERSNVPENEAESKAGVTSVPWHGLNHFLTCSCIGESTV